MGASLHTYDGAKTLSSSLVACVMLVAEAKEGLVLCVPVTELLLMLSGVLVV